MNTLDLQKVGLAPISSTEMADTNGGFTMEELINIMWNLTPGGWNSTWTSNDGTWNGYLWQ
jgi:hypothetical protein